MSTAATKLSEHCDEERAHKILADFYEAGHRETFGMLELLSFAFEEGYKDRGLVAVQAMENEIKGLTEER